MTISERLTQAQEHFGKSSVELIHALDARGVDGEKIWNDAHNEDFVLSVPLYAWVFLAVEIGVDLDWLLCFSDDSLEPVPESAELLRQAADVIQENRAAYEQEAAKLGEQPLWETD